MTVAVGKMAYNDYECASYMNDDGRKHYSKVNSRFADDISSQIQRRQGHQIHLPGNAVKKL